MRQSMPSSCLALLLDRKTQSTTRSVSADFVPLSLCNRSRKLPAHMLPGIHLDFPCHMFNPSPQNGFETHGDSILHARS